MEPARTLGRGVRHVPRAFHGCLAPAAAGRLTSRARAVRVPAIAVRDVGRAPGASTGGPFRFTRPLEYWDVSSNGYCSENPGRDSAMGATKPPTPMRHRPGLKLFAGGVLHALEASEQSVSSVHLPPTFGLRCVTMMISTLCPNAALATPPDVSIPWDRRYRAAYLGRHLAPLDRRSAERRRFP